MKTIVASGSRKRAVARATLSKGNGTIIVNNVPLEQYTPHIYKMRLKEPVILAGDTIKNVNVTITATGGGVAGQTDAARVALSRALVAHQPALEQDFLSYDRLLLVADVRRKESTKPNSHGKARAKRQKSYR